MSDTTPQQNSALDFSALQAKLEALMPVLEVLAPIADDLPALMEWYQERTKQALPYPLDEGSKAAIGGVVVVGTGSSALTQTYTDSRGDTLTGPKAYTGSYVLNVDGKIIEVPYL